MPKGTVLVCPQCKKEYEQVNDEDVYCTGKATKDSVGHTGKKMK